MVTTDRPDRPQPATRHAYTVNADGEVTGDGHSIWTYDQAGRLSGYQAV